MQALNLFSTVHNIVKIISKSNHIEKVLGLIDTLTSFTPLDKFFVGFFFFFFWDPTVRFDDQIHVKFQVVPVPLIIPSILY